MQSADATAAPTTTHYSMDDLVNASYSLGASDSYSISSIVNTAQPLGPVHDATHHSMDEIGGL